MLVGNYLAGARYVVSFNRMDLISSAYAELGLSFILDPDPNLASTAD
jgi:hypothetical protein